MIGKLLGHTQVQTTARYALLARDSIQTAAARITGSIGGNLAPDGARLSRREGMTPPSAVAILTERLDHGLRVSVYDRQQNAGRSVRNPASLLPLLKGADIETETVGEFLTTQPEPLAEGDNPASGGIVDDPAWQLRLAADMGESLAQRRFDLPPEFGAFHCHCPVVPFLIAATTRDSTLVSAGVRSSRSAFA